MIVKLKAFPNDEVRNVTSKKGNELIFSRVWIMGAPNVPEGMTVPISLPYKVSAGLYTLDVSKLLDFSNNRIEINIFGSEKYLIPLTER